MKTALRWMWRIAVALIALLAGLIAILWTPDTDAAAMQAKYGGPPSRFLDLGRGLRVHVRDEGPRGAPVLVLLHGSNADLHTWDGWARSLASRYRIVRYDQIGHGLTGPSPTRDYRPQAFVDQLDAVAIRLGLERFVLAGNSMGGAVAWRYALAHPERLTGLVLIDAAGAPLRAKARLPLGFRLARTPGLRDLIMNLTPRALIERSLRQTVAREESVTPAMVDRYWELLRYPGNRQATVDRFSVPPEPARPERLRALRVPTLVMTGEEDRLIPPSSARWFAATIPGSRLQAYPGVGHIPMEEVPEQTAADLNGWLRTTLTK